MTTTATATARELRLWVCKRHPQNNGPRCLSCLAAMDYNIWRKFCYCGAPANGYRSMGLDLPVEFFCDEHFQDVPVVG